DGGVAARRAASIGPRRLRRRRDGSACLERSAGLADLALCLGDPVASAVQLFSEPRREVAVGLLLRAEVGAHAIEGVEDLLPVFTGRREARQAVLRRRQFLPQRLDGIP